MKFILFCLFAIFINSQVSAQISTIGTQKWTNRNLDVNTFRNGDPIPQATSKSEWMKACENKQPIWCYYNFDPANGVKYGKLYNWYAVNDPRGLAPNGFHIPTHKEWDLLYKNLGSGCCGGTKLKSKSGWKYTNNGTNQFGFSALPSGTFIANDFLGIGTDTEWWSSTEEGTQAFTHGLTYSNGILKWSYEMKDFGFAVRCLKNK